ncbi:MAG: phosphoenolpyruvate-protein phosphotransferase [Gammaproteobacteria bacterium]|nr:phosphoenolpyruvate-protein phosphotransferase [Gammaproteobacteria bacterium]
MSRFRLHAMPFVPGRARGIVRRGMAGAGPDNLLVLAQHELQPFAVPPAGVVVVDGAPLSHPMIRLLGKGIPTVMVTAAQAADLPPGMEAVLDGASGLITDTAVEETVPSAAFATPLRGGELMTADGSAVDLRASVADAAGAATALANGATAIGSLRSEFLAPLAGEQPDAAFYEQALRDVCEIMRPLPVTVRLPDFSPDKLPSWLEPIPGMASALGLRGARLYGIEPVRSVFHAIVQAAARLASEYDLALLIPYVTRLEEFRRLRHEVERLSPVPLAMGSMIETPAAALAISDFLSAADFVTLGCNDLMQGLFAADRDLAEVGALLDPYAPVLFRFLKRLAEEAGDEVGRVQVSGLLPQVPGILPLLLGMGYRVFSVEPVMIPYLAHTVATTDVVPAQALMIAVCAAADAESVRELLGLPRGADWAVGAVARKR